MIFKISFESEKLNIGTNIHLENGHISYVRQYKKILKKNLYGIYIRRL